MSSAVLLALTTASVGLVATAPPGEAFRPRASNTSRTARLRADPLGALAFNTTKLTVPTGQVTVEFTNSSFLPHNITVATSAGRVRARTATFIGGTRALRIELPPGRHTFYCSVPGHEAAGMKGTLTVR